MHIVVLFAVMSAMVVCAQAQDTVYFYNTWERMLESRPSAMIINPVIQVNSPFEVYFETGDDNNNDVIDRTHIAATLGDSIWLINSSYLKRNFKGDAKRLKGFVPVFFDDKVAYANYVNTTNWSVSLNDYLFGDVSFDGETSSVMDHYYIDFFNRKVLKVDHEVLSELLEDYHDLKVRYEGMRDYKEPYMIEEFFYKFVDRASQDVMRPYILDLAPAGNDNNN